MSLLFGSIHCVRSRSHRRALSRIDWVSRVLAVVAASLCLGLAPNVRAEELILGVAGNYTFNSNFFSAANNPQPANSFQFGPSIEINDPDGRFRYEFGYDGAYQAYADQDDVNAWESRLRARASFDLSTKTRIQVTNRFRDISNLRFSRLDISLADTALDPNQDRYFRNDMELALIHDFTDQLQVRMSAEHHWIDFRQNRDRNDSTAWEVGTELRYQLAATHNVGGGFAYTRQNFEEALARFGSTAQYVNAYAAWTWAFAENMTFTANGGPSWVRSDEETSSTVEQTRFVGGRQNGQILRAQSGSCTGLLASNCTVTGGNVAPDLGGLVRTALLPGERVRTDSTVTFLGGVALNADFEPWNVQLSYQRRQSTTSGDGLASSLDRIALQFEYAHPKVRWGVFIAGSWDRRQTLTDSTVIDFNIVPAPATADAERGTATTQVRSDNSTRDNFTLIAGYSYQLERNFSATLDGRYRRTQIQNSGRSGPGIDTFFVVLTFEYDLDPIAF